jgi:LysM repeat protein
VYKLPILGKLYDLKKLTVPVPEEQSSEEQSSEEQSSEEQSSEEQSSEEQGEQLLINLYKYKTINLTFPKLNLVNAGVTKHTKEKEKTIQRIMNDLSNGT